MASFDPTDGTRPLFSRRKNLRVLLLNRSMVSEALKAAATHFGMDESLFSSHCHRIAAASVLSQHGYGEEDIRKFIGWAGRSSLLYERDFANRPSTLRLAAGGTSLSLQDVQAMVPPRRHAAHLLTSAAVTLTPAGTQAAATAAVQPTTVRLRQTVVRAPMKQRRVFSSAGRRLRPTYKCI